MHVGIGIHYVPIETTDTEHTYVIRMIVLYIDITGANRSCAYICTLTQLQKLKCMYIHIRMHCIVCMRHTRICMCVQCHCQYTAAPYLQWFHVLVSRGGTRGRGGTTPPPPSPSLPTGWLESTVDAVHS